MRPIPYLRAAALSAVVLLPASPAVAQADDGTSVEVAILDIMLERGLIDQQQYEELLALARAKVDSQRNELDVLEGRLERLRAPDVQAEGGAPGKLTFSSPDGKWSMRIKGRLQARVTNLDHEDSAKDGTNFSLPRARLGISGNAGGENVTYKLEFDMGTSKSLFDADGGDTYIDSNGDTVFIPDTNTSKGLSLQDAWIDWACENDSAVRLGQFKFPFGREELISSGSISLMERSAASGTFAPGKEPGAMWHGDRNDGIFEYFVAVSNGGGQSLANAENDDGDGLRSGARLAWNPLGPYKPDGPAFQTVGDGGTKVGVGLGFMQNKDSSGRNTLAPGTDTDTLGLDVQVLNGPLSVLAEVFDRSADPTGGPDVDDEGHTLQVGWFLVPDVWELVARTSEVDFETAADIEELTLGVNRYVDGHNAKWMIDINDRDVDGVNTDSKELRVQYQAVF